MNKPAFLRFFFSFAFICAFLFGFAQQPQPITTPREPSPAANVTQTIGISTINVNYSRPSIKGREIWGKLVPFGWNVQPGFGAELPAPWRAGANENTVLTLSHAATVQGHLVPAGKYGLFLIINKDNTGMVILSKQYKNWGSFWYDPQQDEMRADITVRDLPSSTERLTYTFENIDKNSAELELVWEKKEFPVKIQFAVDDIVMANAAEQLKSTAGFTWRGYNSAANYSLANKVNTAQGMKWANRAILIDSNFNDLNTKSGLLELEGNHAEAEKTWQDALSVGTENELNNYGYQLLNEKQFPKAIEVLKLNTQNHPKTANTWDSLGEAYALSGDKKNAIPSFKKSLSLNPTVQTKANSEKYLKQLGAM